MMTENLTGKVALVCGASAGIGRAAATALAERGATVVALARRESRLIELVASLPGDDHRALAADLDDRAGLSALIDSLLGELGTVHILINNAGGPPAGPILAAKEEEFLTAFGRHLFASHLLVQKLVPGMAAAGYGRIINVVSTSVREPIPNLGVSNTTRGAVASWAKSLSRELPSGITINNVLPGFTNTERLDGLRSAVSGRTGKTEEQVQAGWMAQVPEGRLILPEETAATIAFLASPAAGGIRGVSLAVDGGRMRSI
ncbi:MAG: 3-oxoacyl-[acyl-carrier protein] reductase [Myxococcota bacterium]|jgi:3-oxoacyl-[acyl-carrier protein] reductase